MLLQTDLLLVRDNNEQLLDDNKRRVLCARQAVIAAYYT
jgi:hypothetical protein